MNSYEQMLNELENNFESFESAEPNFRARFGNRAVDQLKKVVINSQMQPKSKAVSENYLGNAQFSINIKRVTNTIDAVLPVPIFGTTQLQEVYASSLKGLLPVGVSISSIAVGNGAANSQIALITYTDGTNSDTIQVSCSTVGYGALLAALMTDTMRINKIRYTISDSTKLAQYLNPINFFKKSLFGKSDNDSLTPDTYRVPSQNQNTMIDIDTQFYVDKDTVVIVSMGGNGNNFVVGLNMFVGEYKKLNASNLIRG